MAKIKLSSIGITNISGKAGGTIYANNKGGAYMKNFAVPTNPKTTTQQQRRALFGQLSAMWRGLTQGERNAWEAAAIDFPRRDHFGDVYHLSGNSLFQSFNSNLATLNKPAETQAPVPVDINAVLTLTLDASYSGTPSTFGAMLTATLEDTTGTATAYAIYVTPPLSAGIQNADKRKRWLMNASVTQISTGVDLTSNYKAKFGTPALGTKLFAYVKPIIQATGQASVINVTSDIVDTTV